MMQGFYFAKFIEECAFYRKSSGSFWLKGAQFPGNADNDHKEANEETEKKRGYLG
jgi:hypothetical protein